MIYPIHIRIAVKVDTMNNLIIARRILILAASGIILSLLLVCLVIFTYFSVLRKVDEVICMHQIARKIDIAPTYDSFLSYLQYALVPGMTRQEVINKLEEIGPVEIKTSEDGQLDPVVDKVMLNVCSHPFNHIPLFIRYTHDGKLMGFHFRTDQ
jgi:hypothetical protein